MITVILIIIVIILLRYESQRDSFLGRGRTRGLLSRGIPLPPRRHPCPCTPQALCALAAATPKLLSALASHPVYKLAFVGHSLGGAAALLSTLAVCLYVL
jgi:hypothetical protein